MTKAAAIPMLCYVNAPKQLSLTKQSDAQDLTHHPNAIVLLQKPNNDITLPD